jgi:hypothetical protein
MLVLFFIYPTRFSRIMSQVLLSQNKKLVCDKWFARVLFNYAVIFVFPPKIRLGLLPL